MGICLIAATSIASWLLVILMVSLGLGAVIFVHELGHFAVAKMCGVKCDKFFIGFDIGGYKISRKWGETEYGIGILPLGGYVKMLGQDDNPANIAEQVRESEASGADAPDTKAITGPDGEKFVVDSRSYLAKSVPQRMAIISAGVIMNVIFAFVFAVIAFGVGVPFIPCIVSQTAPGSPAWQAGIHTGDEVVKLGDVEDPSFTELRSGVTLGDLEQGISFQLRRAGTEQIEDLLIKPEQGSGLARVGIVSPMSLRLHRDHPVAPDSAAAKASPSFEGGDEIIAVAGEPITRYYQLAAALVEQSNEPLEVTVRRGGAPPKGNRFGPRTGGKEVTITVPPNPMQRMGLVMEMGKIVAVQDGSPAAQKGIQADDFINKIGTVETEQAEDASEAEHEFDDPIALPEQLRRLANENRDIRLSLTRTGAGNNGRQTTADEDLSLRKTNWIESAIAPDDPLPVPALGIAYRVLNRVARVTPGSPANQAGIQNGDVIVQAEFTLPEDADKDLKAPKPIKFGEEDRQNWPAFMSQTLQILPAGTQIELTYVRGDETAKTTLESKPVDDQFIPQRGFNFEKFQRIRIARSLGEQLTLGYQQTVDSLGMVFRFLRKLGTQVPLTALGGPVTIAQAAGYSAFEGVGKLLVFLTVLSANLAVINFLPIPLLDGGHMVFLAYEGVRGRPASERFVVALHTVGFVFILSLMAFVLSLDFGWIPRNI